MESPTEPSRIAPDTPLRGLNRLLGDLERMEFHLAMAREWARGPNPEKLARWFDESVGAFERYSNVDEALVGVERTPLPDIRGRGRSMMGFSRAVEVTACIKGQDRVEVVGEPSMAVAFVDREVVPGRTTGSAAGPPPHVDLLLLRNTQDQTPTVCVVKVGADGNPFVGLVRALMYAAELSTVSQQRRLMLQYPEAYRGATSPLDVIVLLHVHALSRVRTDLLGATHDLIGKLVGFAGIRRHVRRINLVEGEIVSSGNKSRFALHRVTGR